MKSTKIDPTIQRTLQTTLKKYPLVQDIVSSINQAEGRALLVGGAVRDLLLGIATKDLDIEVHGIEAQNLEAILERFGPVSLVGKVFGVFKLHGLEVDWSLPRADTAGRKPTVTVDPHMPVKKAFARRDLTINAMGIDLTTMELIDPFYGKKDLEEKVLRAPDVTFFVEDPLRLFRVMQFISRFEMYPDKQLDDVCANMDVRAVSVERIEGELDKLLLKSKCPSLGFRWLKEIGRLADIFPELAATIGVPQEPSYHPEGDVFEHTMQTIDAAARTEFEDQEKRIIFMYAALCHDLGKVGTTQQIDGVWRSLGHEKESEKVAKRFLKRFTNNKDRIAGVCVLVKYHMIPMQFIEGRAKLSAYKRLANKLAPHATLQMLADLARADRRGRNPEKLKPLTIETPDIDLFLHTAQRAAVRETVEAPVLMGRDLMDVIEPGPQMGELLKKAYELQLEEGITDKDELKARVLSDDAG